METLRIGGFTPLTTLDFPGNLAAVVFCQGCPWRCDYCQNTPLQLASTAKGQGIDWARIKTFLERRHGLLDGVVFSGGEPTAQAALGAALIETRAMGFRTGLHTAGIYPRRLMSLFSTLDWIALDAKAPLDLYSKITGVPGAGMRFQRSLDGVIGSGLDYEIRTTIYAGATIEGMTRLARWLAKQGVRHYAWQTRRILDAFGYPQHAAEEESLWRKAGEDISPWFESFQFRGTA
ncbi:anaerobic ribonucleoside-triphosphate reductase activating protein [Acidihalobacter yilgarnensis]|uniref:anaerobic ribonucleoside-triphosphate reductase activating protein n=1 Tax=Acidihalobacter yilgarnensis TaxID=2819280 RepID=UPI0009F2D775|nr:anaerobic ribonucleoside-triphosphate reductase activating protein [Acidihalobacter yilgarnensis]